MPGKKVGYILVNFGGPRDLEEVHPFLECLLTDQDVIRTKLPRRVQNWLFRRIAKRRSKKVKKDYASIGGSSPIFEDTENLAYSLRKWLEEPVYTFHRYLPSMHDDFCKKIIAAPVDEFRVFPMFPQFCYATTGSIARFFQKNLPFSVVNRFHWIKSYCGHPKYVHAYQTIIREYLNKIGLEESKTLLLFSAHGVPKKFIEEGDIYEYECRMSFEKIGKAFPSALRKLCYQSKFGPGEWLRPYTTDVCRKIDKFNEGKNHIVFVPLSFTSDHIETLFEIEQLYLPVIRKRKLKAYRCPALNLHPIWVHAVKELLQETNLLSNQMLIR